MAHMASPHLRHGPLARSLAVVLLVTLAAAAPAAAASPSGRGLLAANQDCNCNFWCPTDSSSWHCWPGSPR
jgi:hypothetical protein